MAANLSLAEANRQHWDNMASKYEAKDWQKKMIATLISAIRSRRSIFGFPPAEATDNDSQGDQPHRPFRLLDYACGTGVVTRALGPYATSTLGLDLSANMVATYNAGAASAGLSARAVQADLLAQPAYLVLGDDGARATEDDGVLDRDEFGGFDAVVVGLGFHHFEDWARCLRVLSKRCRVGGVVGIVDLLQKEGHLNGLPDGMRAIMHKSGFSEAEMREYMREADLVDVRFEVLHETVHMEIHGQDVEREVFFASGRRTA